MNTRHKKDVYIRFLIALISIRMRQVTNPIKCLVLMACVSPTGVIVTMCTRRRPVPLFGRDVPATHEIYS